MRKARHYRGGFQVAGLADRARELRAKQTAAESHLWQFLRKKQLLGFKFRRQHQFGDYIVDFYCHEARLVIECDGLVHSRNEQWQHDQARDLYLTSNDVRVLRFTNSQVLGDVNGVLKTISGYLRNHEVELSKPRIGS